MRPPTDDKKNPHLAADYRALYYALREKAWLLAALTVIGVLAATAYLARSRKIYAATTTIQVEEE